MWQSRSDMRLILLASIASVICVSSSRPGVERQAVVNNHNVSITVNGMLSSHQHGKHEASETSSQQRKARECPAPVGGPMDCANDETASKCTETGGQCDSMTKDCCAITKEDSSSSEPFVRKGTKLKVNEAEAFKDGHKIEYIQVWDRNGDVGQEPGDCAYPEAGNEFKGTTGRTLPDGAEIAAGGPAKAINDIIMIPLRDRRGCVRADDVMILDDEPLMAETATAGLLPDDPGYTPLSKEQRDLWKEQFLKSFHDKNGNVKDAGKNDPFQDRLVALEKEMETVRKNDEKKKNLFHGDDWDPKLKRKLSKEAGAQEITGGWDPHKHHMTFGWTSDNAWDPNLHRYKSEKTGTAQWDHKSNIQWESWKGDDGIVKRTKEGASWTQPGEAVSLGARIDGLKDLTAQLDGYAAKARLLAGGVGATKTGSEYDPAGPQYVVGIQSNLDNWLQKSRAFLGNTRNAKAYAKLIVNHFNNAWKEARKRDNFRELQDREGINLLKIAHDEMADFPGPSGDQFRFSTDRNEQANGEQIKYHERTENGVGFPREGSQFPRWYNPALHKKSQDGKHMEYIGDNGKHHEHQHLKQDALEEGKEKKYVNGGTSAHQKE